MGGRGVGGRCCAVRVVRIPAGGAGVGGRAGRKEGGMDCAVGLWRISGEGLCGCGHDLIVWHVA
jgi:hypothetical protein